MTKQKILLTGSNGMLAHDFRAFYSEEFEIVGHDKDTLDITDIAAVRTMLAQVQPACILNCAAYTNVEDAEDVGEKLNYDVNAIGVSVLAQVAAEMHIDFVTISTDYVFAGTEQTGYQETDVPNPCNRYGMAKYLGERLAQQLCPASVIVRTSWLYGGGPQFKNFVNTMIKLAQTRDELRIIDDQRGAPTYTQDLAAALATIIRDISKYRGHILHCANETPAGGITWYQFTTGIMHAINKNIKLTPITTADYPCKARRPQYSKLVNTSDLVLPAWEESLKQYVQCEISS